MSDSNTIARRRWFLGSICIAVAATCGLSSLEQARAQSLEGFPKVSTTNDWPWWRGPLRNGIAGNATLPVQFGPTQGVVWKTAVPGRGHSSPIVVGDLVLLTTADEGKQVHSVLAYDRRTGQERWKVDVSRGGFPARNHPKNTEASSTLACDGELVFATFYHHEQAEVIALDLTGKIVWRQAAGPFHPKRYEYGYAPSPVLYQNLVIVATEHDGPSALTALNRKTGKPVWKTPRPNNISFSTPVVARVAGRDQLLISGADQVVSYDPATGKQLWKADGTTAATCGTLVWDGDTVFASGGYPKAETLAVKADGSGRVLWKNNQKCYEQSMIVVDGYVYGLTDNGVYFCWRGSDGQEMWKQRLRGPVSASPVFAGGHIYWANELGTLYVIKPNPQRYEQVAENQIESESFASPAIAGNQIFLRVASGNGLSRKETLYCFGE